MEQSIFEIMWKNTPTITIFFGGVFITGFVVSKTVKLYNRFEKTESAVVDLGTRMTKVEQRLDALEVRLVVVETKLDVLAEKVDKLTERVDKLSDKFDRLIETLLIKNKEAA